jgi:hypothetical protein
MIVLAYLFASFVGILCAGLLMLIAFPLASAWRRFKGFYPFGMGLLALVVGWSSVFIASTIVRWMGFSPGIVLALLIGVGWLQNDLRRAIRAKDKFIASAEWKMLAGRSFGVVIGALLNG